MCREVQLMCKFHMHRVPCSPHTSYTESCRPKHSALTGVKCHQYFPRGEDNIVIQQPDDDGGQRRNTTTCARDGGSTSREGPGSKHS